MKPAPFAYARPGSIAEALALLDEYGDEAKLLGGGQSLMPLLNMRLARPSVLVDLGYIPELAGIEVNGTVSIRAMTRHAHVEKSSAVGAALPIIPAALRHVGHAAIRARGTFGGSIAHADPAAELPLIFTVLDGEAVIATRNGPRTVPAHEFFSTHFTTAIEEDELLQEVRFTSLTSNDRWAFDEVARRHGDFALVGAATVLTVSGPSDDAIIERARIAMSGVDEIPARATEAEALLVGSRVSDTARIAEAAASAAAGVDPGGDIHASAEYRREVAETLVRRTVTQALTTGAER